MQGVIQKNYQSDYRLLRAEANEDASPLDLATEGDFANKPAGAVEIKGDEIEMTIRNKIALIFCGGAAAAKTFTYKVYGWRRDNGPAELICTGTGTLGTQAVVVYPQGGAATLKFWAHKLANTARWLTSCLSSDSTGNNEIAKLSFSLNGYRWIHVEISAADGATGDEAGNVSVYYAYWS